MAEHGRFSSLIKITPRSDEGTREGGGGGLKIKNGERNETARRRSTTTTTREALAIRRLITRFPVNFAPAGWFFFP